ncbi:8897_t:CDS:2 [Funneliformis caledonium]|uniref:8897_t:CDS:1 n=1 Tax=Funneliformis caledonium TaxID=1117310 RepID=A0A9N9ELI7_9GLOM|nr:8897_t:CDS:2 [Funneliformis caledonium]
MLVSNWFYVKNIPESLVSLKDILCLKSDILNVLNAVNKIKRITLRTSSENLFTINNLPKTTPFPTDWIIS